MGKIADDIGLAFEAYRTGYELAKEGYKANKPLTREQIEKAGQNYSRLQKLFLSIGIKQAKTENLERILQEKYSFH